MQTEAEKRAVLEAMGPDQVRFLLHNGMLVWHLVVPATQWLAERDKAAK